MLLKQDYSEQELKGGKIALWIMIIFCLFVGIHGNYFSYSLRKHFIVTTGTIYKLTNFGRSSPTARYTYVIAGKSYEGSQPHPDFINFQDRHVLVGKAFPIVVDSTHQSHAEMLFDSLECAEFSINYPDSIKWLSKYLK